MSDLALIADSQVKRLDDAHDRLYKISHQIHATLQHGHTSLTQANFEELLKASMLLLTECDIVASVLSPKSQSNAQLIKRFEKAAAHLGEIAAAIKKTLSHGHTSLKQGVFEDLLQSSMALLPECDVIASILSTSSDMEFLKAFGASRDRLGKVTRQIHEAFAFGIISVKQTVFDELLESALELSGHCGTAVTMLQADKKVTKRFASARANFSLGIAIC